MNMDFIDTKLDYASKYDFYLLDDNVEINNENEDGDQGDLALQHDFILIEDESPQKNIEELERLENEHKENKPSREVQFQISLLKTKVYQKDAVDVVNTGNGVNGAKFLKDKVIKNKTIAVYKEPNIVPRYNLKENLKYYVGQKRLLSTKYFSQEYAEIAACLLNKALSFDVAPLASQLELDGKIGVFIEYLDGFSPLEEQKNAFCERKEFSEEELTEWQQMCIFNFLVGNLDPHSENIFVQFDMDKKLLKANMIDFGNAFPIKRPGKFGSLGHEGEWGDYPISNKSFTQKTVDFIQKNFTKKNIELFFEQVEKECPGFMLPEMKKLMLERIEILTLCVSAPLQIKRQENYITSPKQLSQIHYDKDYSSYAKTIEVSFHKDKYFEKNF